VDDDTEEPFVGVSLLGSYVTLWTSPIILQNHRGAFAMPGFRAHVPLFDQGIQSYSKPRRYMCRQKEIV